MRWVTVATMRRGALDVPEQLNAEDSDLATHAKRYDEQEEKSGYSSSAITTDPSGKKREGGK